MKKDVPMVPTLRFPEFDGEWESKKSKHLFLNSRSKGNDTLPIYSVTLDQGLVPRNSLKRKMTNVAKFEGNLAVKAKDIAFNMMRMWQGAVGIANQECMVSPAYIVLRPQIDVSSDFFIQLFDKKRSLYLFTSYSYGLTSDRLRLYFKDFASIKFSTPLFPEQQKIASFLSAVDKKIQQLSRKKELLEQYKKGVMQKIFSHENRFKDENDQEFPPWQDKRLVEIGSTFNGLTGKSANDFGQGRPFITYKQIFDDAKIDITKFQYVQVCDGEKQSNVYYGDVLFTTSSETRLEVGVSSVLLDKIENLYLNSFCFGFRINSHNVFAPEFARYLFRSEQFRAVIIKLGQGSTRYNISKHMMMGLHIFLPSKDEQQKISVFLSNIDKKIEAVQIQHSQTQTFKKGLLQQMFV